MPSLRLLLVRLYPRIRGTSDASPPPSFDKKYIMNSRRHAVMNVAGKLSNSRGSYPINCVGSWDGDKQHLVQFEESDAEFLEMRTRDLWSMGHLDKFHESGLVASRLSSNFTTLP